MTSFELAPPEEGPLADLKKKISEQHDQIKKLENENQGLKARLDRIIAAIKNAEDVKNE